MYREGGGWSRLNRFVLLTDFRTHTHLNNGQKPKTNSPSFSFIHWIALYWKKVFVWRTGEGGRPLLISSALCRSVGRECEGEIRTVIIIISLQNWTRATPPPASIVRRPRRAASRSETAGDRRRPEGPRGGGCTTVRGRRRLLKLEQDVSFFLFAQKIRVSVEKNIITNSSGLRTCLCFSWMKRRKNMVRSTMQIFRSSLQKTSITIFHLPS